MIACANAFSSSTASLKGFLTLTVANLNEHCLHQSSKASSTKIFLKNISATVSTKPNKFNPPTATNA